MEECLARQLDPARSVTCEWLLGQLLLQGYLLPGISPLVLEHIPNIFLPWSPITTPWGKELPISQMGKSRPRGSWSA